jgi:SAM-dependent methyltransferase
VTRRPRKPPGGSCVLPPAPLPPPKVGFPGPPGGWVPPLPPPLPGRLVLAIEKTLSKRSQRQAHTFAVTSQLSDCNFCAVQARDPSVWYRTTPGGNLINESSQSPGTPHLMTPLFASEQPHVPKSKSIGLSIPEGANDFSVGPHFWSVLRGVRRPASGSGSLSAISFPADTIFARARSNSSSLIFPSRCSCRRSDSEKPIPTGVSSLLSQLRTHETAKKPSRISAISTNDQPRTPAIPLPESAKVELVRAKVMRVMLKRLARSGQSGPAAARSRENDRRTDTLSRMGRAKSILRAVLAHPSTRNINLDDPSTATVHRELIQSKPFLRRIYDEWYSLLKSDLPVGPGEVLELGSGAGFLSEYIPNLLTSEISPSPRVRLALDGQQMPLADGALRAIVMTDVFHHIPNVRRFLAESARTVRSGGVVAMVEPWHSRWANWVYTRFHHEPFRPDTKEWEFATRGPLSGSNQALAWVVFKRDRALFEAQFPQWTIETLQPFMPFRYLISGGVSMRSMAPGFTFGMIKAMEKPVAKSMAMFAHIVLRRTDVPSGGSA